MAVNPVFVECPDRVVSLCFDISAILSFIVFFIFILYFFLGFFFYFLSFSQFI